MRRIITSLSAKYNLNISIKEHEMSSACSMNGEKKNGHRISMEKPGEGDRKDDTCMGEDNIKMVLKRWNWLVLPEMMWFMIGSNEEFM
jgi:hypothetical protein